MDSPYRVKIIAVILPPLLLDSLQETAIDELRELQVAQHLSAVRQIDE